jgi:hypothetical protein
MALTTSPSAPTGSRSWSRTERADAAVELGRAGLHPLDHEADLDEVPGARSPVSKNGVARLRSNSTVVSCSARGRSRAAPARILRTTVLDHQVPSTRRRHDDRTHESQASVSVARSVTGRGSFADIRGPGWPRLPNLAGGPAGRVTRETLHRIPACITMHRRSPAKLPDVCRDPPAREVSLTAACRRPKTIGSADAPTREPPLPRPRSQNPGPG